MSFSLISIVSRLIFSLILIRHSSRMARTVPVLYISVHKWLIKFMSPDKSEKKRKQTAWKLWRKQRLLLKSNHVWVFLPKQIRFQSMIMTPRDISVNKTLIWLHNDGHDIILWRKILTLVDYIRLHGLFRELHVFLSIFLNARATCSLIWLSCPSQAY